MRNLRNWIFLGLALLILALCLLALLKPRKTEVPAATEAPTETLTETKYSTFPIADNIITASVRATCTAAHTQLEALAWMDSQVGSPLKPKGTEGSQAVDLALAYCEYLGVSRSGDDSLWDCLPDSWEPLPSEIPQPGDILIYGTEDEISDTAVFASNDRIYHQDWQENSCMEKVTDTPYDGFPEPYWGVVRPVFAS